jgi:hypothetical protein
MLRPSCLSNTVVATEQADFEGIYLIGLSMCLLAATDYRDISVISYHSARV